MPSDGLVVETGSVRSLGLSSGFEGQPLITVELQQTLGVDWGVRAASVNESNEAMKQYDSKVYREPSLCE